MDRPVRGLLLLLGTPQPHHIGLIKSPADKCPRGHALSLARHRSFQRVRGPIRPRMRSLANYQCAKAVPGAPRADSRSFLLALALFRARIYKRATLAPAAHVDWISSDSARGWSISYGARLRHIRLINRSPLREILSSLCARAPATQSGGWHFSPAARESQRAWCIELCRSQGFTVRAACHFSSLTFRTVPLSRGSASPRKVRFDRSDTCLNVPVISERCRAVTF